MRTDGREAEVELAGGDVVATRDVLCGAAPAVLARLLGEDGGGAPAGPAPEGSQLKLNLLLRRLPRLRDPDVDPREAFAGTFHVHESAGELDAAHAAALAGRIPDPVPCELYCHSLADPSILGPELRAAGAQTLTCFALHLPARLFRADPGAAREAAVAATLRSLDDVLAEPVEDLLWRDADGRPCLEARTPARPRGRAPPPGRAHLPPRPRVAVRRGPAEAGRWGVETAPPQRLALRRGRATRRRRQRHPRAQRRPGRAQRSTSALRTTCERVRTTRPSRCRSRIRRSRSALSRVRTRAIASGSPVTRPRLDDLGARRAASR